MPQFLRLLYKIPLQHYRIVRFVISGVTTTAVNFAILYSLTELLRVWYVLSAVVAVTAGFAVGFILQKFWTFEHESLDKLHVQFSLYVGVGIANVVLNAILLYALVQYGHLWYIAAQILCSVSLATMNFFVYRHFIFTHGTPQ